MLNLDLMYGREGGKARERERDKHSPKRRARYRTPLTRGDASSGATVGPSLQCFGEVRCLRTSPNSLEPSLYACIPLRHSGSRRFGEVDPPQTHSNLPCRPASPYITVVREGSVQLNLPELTPNCHSYQLPPSSQWFE